MLCDIQALIQVISKGYTYMCMIWKWPVTTDWLQSMIYTVRPCICKVRHTGVYHLHGFNPFTAPACKISRLKDARRRLQTVYSGPVTQPSVLCDLGWKSFYMPMRKRLQGFRFQTLIGRFHVTSWRWRDESFDCLNGVYCLQGAIPDSLLFAGHEHHWELGSCWFHHLPERLSEHNMWPAPHRCIAQCTSGNMG